MTSGFRSRQAFAIFALLLVLPGVSVADTIVLLNGTRIEGVVANREEVARSPGLFGRIAILPDGSDDLRRVPVAEISYVLLLDGDVQRVVDFGSLKSPDTSAPRTAYPNKPIFPETEDPGKRRRDNGIALVIFGAGALAVGVLMKFGDAEVVINESGIEAHDKTYNGLNYALIAAGGIGLIGGILLHSSGQKASVYGYFDPGLEGVVAGLAFRF